MGQAKNRGTFEERKEKAIQHAIDNPPQPKPRVRLTRRSIEMLALMQAAGINANTLQKGR